MTIRRRYDETSREGNLSGNIPPGTRVTLSMKPASTPLFEAVCSVCLHQHVLTGDRPIRHGWHAHNVRHGENRGWHDGPCSGVRFPHFGLSTDGTRWALDGVRGWTADLTTALATHQTRPPLTWRHPQTERDRRRGAPAPEKRELRPGDEADYRAGAPSYESLWRSREADLVDQIDAGKRQIQIYEAAIRDWKPCDPVPHVVAPSLVHLAHEYRSPRGPFIGPRCRRPPRPNQSQTTTNPALVTCGRCKGVT